MNKLKLIDALFLAAVNCVVVTCGGGCGPGLYSVSGTCYPCAVGKFVDDFFFICFDVL